MNFFRGVLMVLIAVAVLSCDAPHLNPVDPQNPDYKISQVDGYVLTNEQPRVAISKAKVVWKNENILTYTDSTGYFKIGDLQRVNGKLYFEKDGFSKDSVLVDWKNQNSKRIETVLLSYTNGNIDGYVQTTTTPVQPISKVKIYWKNANVIVETSSSGYYKIENVPIKSGWIYFEKDGYNKDSVYVNWTSEQTKHVDIFSLAHNIGDLDGFVMTSALPSEAITDVKVYWKNSDMLVETNSLGYYKISSVSIKSGWLYFEKSGFKSDSLYVEWTTEKTLRVKTVTLIYNYGGLDGYIYAADQPSVPLSNVLVYWKNQNVYTQSSVNGYYKIETVPISSGWLYFEKDGYNKDSVYVNWTTEKTLRISNVLLTKNTGYLDGYVYANDPPYSAINKAKVYWKNTNVFTETNSSGYYKIDNVPIKSGWISFEKDNFKKDSIYVNWSSEVSKRVNPTYLNYNIGSITGTVYTVAVPRVGIGNTNIYWKNNNIIVQTESNGKFTVNNVPTENGYLYFNKTGYSPDSVYVSWGSKNLVSVEGFLNANPVLDSLSIYTVVQNRIPDIQTIRLTIEAKVSDVEFNDIKSVYVQNKSLGLLSQLTYNQSTKFFERTFNISDLNIDYMDEAVGTSFEIVVHDQSERVFNIGKSAIKRIISLKPTLISPANGETTDANPTLSWYRYLPGFNFKYQLQIYTDEIPPSFIWQNENIYKDEISLLPSVTLSTGGYYWILWVVDDFGNRCSSFPGTFKVQ